MFNAPPAPPLRFYIGCDRCQNWYHGRCVGILQSEANHIDQYVCPQCQSTEDAMTVLTPLTDKDFEGLRRILRSLQVMTDSSLPPPPHPPLPPPPAATPPPCGSVSPSWSA